MAGLRSDWHAVADQPTVSSRVVKEIAAALERAGIPRSRFLEAAELAPDLLDGTDARLTLSQAITAAETALDLTGDPAFGLHWGEWITANSFALMSQLLAHSPTLRAAFGTLFRFGDLVSDHTGIGVYESADRAEVRFTGVRDLSLRLRRLSSEVAMLGIFRMIRDFRPLASVIQVNFAYAAPEYRSEYTRVFQGAERFEQRFTGLVFDRALLDLPSRHEDRDVEHVLRGLAERRVSALRRRVSYAARIRELLLRERAPQRVAMNAIAEQLGVSLRSLHRRLVDEGASFSSLANEASATVAKRMLADERRTVRETACAMGFSDPSAFHRAFKRWTGTTPAKFIASV